MAGYKNKSWQSLENVNTINEQAAQIFKTVADIYSTSENEAKEAHYSKGTQEAANSFPSCTMTDTNFIQDARCEIVDANYLVTLTIKDVCSSLYTPYNVNVCPRR